MFTTGAQTQQFDSEETHERQTEPGTTARVPLTNETLASGLESIGRLLPRGGVQARALFRAAALIRFWPHAVARAVEEAGLEGVHAIGIDYELSGVVTDWVRSGRLPWLERLQARRRRELTEVPGIGPRLAEELREVLGVFDLDGLAAAAADGRLLQIYGFGPKRVKLIAGLLSRRAVT